MYFHLNVFSSLMYFRRIVQSTKYT